MTGVQTCALPISIWKKSMDQELKAQIDKNTWELVIPPKNINIVGSKWVFSDLYAKATGIFSR